MSAQALASFHASRMVELIKAMAARQSLQYAGSLAAASRLIDVLGQTLEAPEVIVSDVMVLLRRAVPCDSDAEKETVAQDLNMLLQALHEGHKAIYEERSKS